MPFQSLRSRYVRTVKNWNSLSFDDAIYKKKKGSVGFFLLKYFKRSSIETYISTLYQRTALPPRPKAELAKALPAVVVAAALPEFPVTAAPVCWPKLSNADPVIPVVVSLLFCPVG